MIFSEPIDQTGKAWSNDYDLMRKQVVGTLEAVQLWHSWGLDLPQEKPEPVIPGWSVKTEFYVQSGLGLIHSTIVKVNANAGREILDPKPFARLAADFSSESLHECLLVARAMVVVESTAAKSSDVALVRLCQLDNIPKGKMSLHLQREYGCDPIGTDRLTRALKILKDKDA